VKHPPTPHVVLTLCGCDFFHCSGDCDAAAGVCVAVYFGISAFWQYLAWFVERDYVCASRPQTVRPAVRNVCSIMIMQAPHAPGLH